MKEPEHIKEIHQIREKMAKQCNYDSAQFAKTIRQAETKKRRHSHTK